MKRGKNLFLILISFSLLMAGFLLMQAPLTQGVFRTTPYLLIGIGCGLFGYSLNTTITRTIERQYPEIAAQKQIETQDERNQALLCRAKAKAYDVMTYAFAVLILFYAFLGSSIEIVLPSIFVYLSIEFSALFFRIKYEKEM